jgi:hypothetical protein
MKTVGRLGEDYAPPTAQELESMFGSSFPLPTEQDNQIGKNAVTIALVGLGVLILFSFISRK